MTFFFLGVHLEGWAEGLALLFIPEVCSEVVIFFTSVIFFFISEPRPGKTVATGRRLHMRNDVFEFN